MARRPSPGCSWPGLWPAQRPRSATARARVAEQWLDGELSCAPLPDSRGPASWLFGPGLVLVGPTQALGPASRELVLAPPLLMGPASRLLLAPPPRLSLVLLQTLGPAPGSSWWTRPPFSRPRPSPPWPRPLGTHLPHHFDHGALVLEPLDGEGWSGTRYDDGGRDAQLPGGISGRHACVASCRGQMGVSLWDLSQKASTPPQGAAPRVLG